MKNLIVFLTILCTFPFGSCISNNAVSHVGKSNLTTDSIQTPIFKPDISINRILFLNHPSSIEKTFGNIMQLLDKNADLPDVYMVNKSRQEYLRMIILPGSSINSVSLFEVGYSSSLNNIISKKNTELLSFVTESNIRLGMTIKEIKRIKGFSYTERKVGKTKVIRYIIDNINKSTFLKKYNMPIYISEYWFSDNILIKFRFGFEYP